MPQDGVPQSAITLAVEKESFPLTEMDYIIKERECQLIFLRH